MFKRIKIKFLAFVFICTCVICLVLHAEQSFYSFPATDAKGSWQIGKIGDKNVILTEKANEKGYITIDVPKDGYYQLYISLYHSWRKYCPFLYIDVVDSKGKHYSNYTFSEPRWYLEAGKGRWEFRSPSAFPFWHLHEGKLKMEFWLVSKNSPWVLRRASVEGEVAIGKFVLIPIEKNKMIQMNPDFDN